MENKFSFMQKYFLYSIFLGKRDKMHKAENKVYRVRINFVDENQNNILRIKYKQKITLPLSNMLTYLVLNMV